MSEKPCAPCEAAKQKRLENEQALMERSGELRTDAGNVKLLYRTIGGSRVQCGREEYLFRPNKIAVDVTEACAQNWVNNSRATFPTTEQIELLPSYTARLNAPAPVSEEEEPGTVTPRSITPKAQKTAKKAAKPAGKTGIKSGKSVVVVDEDDGQADPDAK